MTVSGPQTSTDTRDFVKGIDANDELLFGQVGIQDIDFFARFGAKVGSTTEHDISVGTKLFTIDVDTDKIKVGDDLQISSLADPHSCFMYGTVIARNTTNSPGDVTVVVNDISALTGTYADWELQVVARPKAWLEVDISETSIDPTDDGPFTMTVTAGKLFPIAGSVLLRSIVKPQIVVLCRVFNYNSTTLILTKLATNATVSETLSSWDVALIDGPPAGIPFLQRNGLQVSVSGTTLTVTKGTILDSTKTYDLVLTDTITKDMTALFAAGDGNGCQILSENLQGTIAFSGSGNTYTGTGTAFESDFADSVGPPFITFEDFTNRGGTLVTGSPRLSSTAITAGGNTDRIGTLSSDTSVVIVGGNLGALPSGTAYQRGGYKPSQIYAVDYGVLLLRKDSDGSVDVGIYSLNPNTAPDLPSGWSVYGALAQLYYAGGGSVTSVNQWFDVSFDLIAPPATEDGDLIAWDGSTYAAMARTKTVDSGSFPSAATLDVAIPAGYSDILISWDGVSFDTAARRLAIVASTNGGSTFDTTATPFANTQINETTGSVSSGSVASFINTSDQGAGATCSGTLLISGYGTGGYKPFIGQNRTTTPSAITRIGTYLSTDAITNIRFLLSGSGNFDAGTYIVSVK